MSLSRFRKLSFFPLLSLPVLLSSCSLYDSVPGFDAYDSQMPSAMLDPELKEESNALHAFLMAEFSYMDENYEEALEYYARVGQQGQGSPIIHARLADLYLRSAKLEEARTEIEKAIQLRPDDESYLLLYAGILESLGDWKKALPVYEKIIQADARATDVRLLLANLYLRQGEYGEAARSLRKAKETASEEDSVLVDYYLARALEAQKKYDQALKVMLSVYERKGKSKQLANEIIRIYVGAGKEKELKGFCEEVVKTFPHHRLARKVLGELALGQKNLASVEKQLRALEEMSEDTTESRFRLALIYLDQNNWKKAEQELLLVLSNKPEHHKARYLLASIYAGSNRVGEAFSELEKIPSNSELFVKARTFAAFLYRQIGEPGSAEKTLEELLAKRPEEKKARSYYLLVLRDNKKYKDALAVIDEALETEPEDTALLYDKSLILHELGDHEESLELMREVLKREPGNAEALNFLAYSLIEKDPGPEEIAEAEKLIEKALKLRPEDGYFLDTLGWLQYQKGHYAEASETLYKSLQKTDGDPVVHEHYADCLRKLNKLEEASVEYARLLERLETEKGSEDDEQRDIRRRVEEKLDELRDEFPELNNS